VGEVQEVKVQEEVRAGCCARAARGNATAPPRSAMKSRRLMGLPQGQRVTDQV